MTIVPNPCSDVVLSLNRLFDWLTEQEQTLATVYGYEDKDFDIGDREGSYEKRFQVIVFLTVNYHLFQEAHSLGIPYDEYLAKYTYTGLVGLVMWLAETHTKVALRCMEFTGVSEDLLPPVSDTIAYGVGLFCSNYKGMTGKETDLDRLEEMIDKPFSYFYPTDNDNCSSTS
jgi:hypothetical protein